MSATKKKNVFELLIRHAKGEDLDRIELGAMYLGLYDIWRRDSLIRKWAKLRDGVDYLDCRVHLSGDITIADVISSLISKVVERTWPKYGNGKGEVTKVTSGYIAFKLRVALLDAWRKGKSTETFINNLQAVYSSGKQDYSDIEYDGLQVDEAELPKDLKEALDAETTENDDAHQPDENRDPIDSKTTDSGITTQHHKDIEKIPVFENWVSDSPEPQNTLENTEFERRCLWAAQQFLPSQSAEFKRVVDCFLAPYYIEDLEISGVFAAKQLGMSESTLSRRLQEFGIRLKPKDFPDDLKINPIVSDVWKQTPLGQYLINGCGLERHDEKREFFALQTLCECNSENLGTLSSRSS